MLPWVRCLLKESRYHICNSFPQIKDPSWRDRAHRELGESPEVVAVSLKQLRQFLYSEPDRELTRTDDAFLLRFLRAKKFDVEKASKMVRFRSTLIINFVFIIQFTN